MYKKQFYFYFNFCMNYDQSIQVYEYNIINMNIICLYDTIIAWDAGGILRS